MSSMREVFGDIYNFKFWDADDDSELTNLETIDMCVRQARRPPQVFQIKSSLVHSPLILILPPKGWERL